MQTQSPGTLHINVQASAGTGLAHVGLLQLLAPHGANFSFKDASQLGCSTAGVWASAIPVYDKLNSNWEIVKIRLNF